MERLLAGLDTLGMDRKQALAIVKDVALDSVPPLRRRAYDCVCKYSNVETADVAIALDLPTNTARRILEDLAAHAPSRACASTKAGTALVSSANLERRGWVSVGYEPTREAAMAAFAKSWRRE